MRTLGIVLASLLVLIQYPLWLGKGGWLRVWELDRQLHAQQEVNARLASRNSALQAEVDDLRAGKQALEERACYELGMVMPGEIFVQINEAGAPARHRGTDPHRCGGRDAAPLSGRACGSRAAAGSLAGRRTRCRSRPSVPGLGAFGRRRHRMEQRDAVDQVEAVGLVAVLAAHLDVAALGQDRLDLVAAQHPQHVAHLVAGAAAREAARPMVERMQRLLPEQASEQLVGGSVSSSSGATVSASCCMRFQPSESDSG